MVELVQMDILCYILAFAPLFLLCRLLRIPPRFGLLIGIFLLSLDLNACFHGHLLVNDDRILSMIEDTDFVGRPSIVLGVDRVSRL
jgi:hypothetical protein